MLRIQNGLLHAMKSEHPFQDDLLIDQGKILQISDHIAPAERMQIIDASGLRADT